MAYKMGCLYLENYTLRQVCDEKKLATVDNSVCVNENTMPVLTKCFNTSCFT